PLLPPGSTRFPYTTLFRSKAFGINEGYFIEGIIVDTLGFTLVKDSLFNSSSRYKTMMNVPIEGVTENFELNAGKVTKNDAVYPVDRKSTRLNSSHVKISYA